MLPDPPLERAPTFAMRVKDARPSGAKIGEPVVQKMGVDQRDVVRDFFFSQGF